MRHDTLIEYILMLVSNIKAYTSVSSSYRIVVNSFKVADTIFQCLKSVQTMLLNVWINIRYILTSLVVNILAIPSLVRFFL